MSTDLRKEAQEWFDKTPSAVFPRHHGDVVDILSSFAQHVLQSQQPNEEPVAWMNENGTLMTAPEKLFKERLVPGCTSSFTIPLYAHSPASTEPRLTVEQAMEAWRSTQTAWNLDEESYLRDRLAKAAKP